MVNQVVNAVAKFPSSSTNRLTEFTIACVCVGFFILAIASSAILHSQLRFTKQLSWLRTILYLVPGILFIPTMTAFAKMFFSCFSMSAGAPNPFYPSVQCWKADHIGFSVLSVVFMSAWMLISLIVSMTFVDFRIPTNLNNMPYAASSSGRMEALEGHLVFILLVLYAGIHNTTGRHALSSICIVFGFILMGNHIRFLPFYNDDMQTFVMFRASMLALSGFCSLLVTTIPDDSDGFSILFYTMAPCLLIVSYMAVRGRYGYLESLSLRDLDEPYNFELACRAHLRNWVRLEKEGGSGLYLEETPERAARRREMQVTCEKILIDGVARFPESSYLHAYLAIFYICVADNRVLAYGELQVAETKKPKIDVEFILFKFRRLLDRESVGSQSLEVQSYLEFKARKELADVAVMEAARCLVDFWSHLLRPEPDIDELAHQGHLARGAMSRATNHFEKLLAINPNSIPVLRSFGTFALDIMGDVQKSAVLFDRAEEAERHREQNTNKVAQHGDFLQILEQNLDIFDEDNGVYGITLDRAHFGEIENVSASGRRMVGYTQENNLLRKNIKIIVPSPMMENHDRYMQDFLLRKTGRIINQTRMTFALHRVGHIFPVNLYVRWSDAANGKIVGVMQEITHNNDAHLIVNPKTQRVTYCTQNAYSLFGILRRQLNAGDVRLSDIVQCLANEDDLDSSERKFEAMMSRVGLETDVFNIVTGRALRAHCWGLNMQVYEEQALFVRIMLMRDQTGRRRTSVAGAEGVGSTVGPGLSDSENDLSDGDDLDDDDDDAVDPYAEPFNPATANGPRKSYRAGGRKNSTGGGAAASGNILSPAAAAAAATGAGLTHQSADERLARHSQMAQKFRRNAALSGPTAAGVVVGEDGSAVSARSAGRGGIRGGSINGGQGQGAFDTSSAKNFGSLEVPETADEAVRRRKKAMEKRKKDRTNPNQAGADVDGVEAQSVGTSSAASGASKSSNHKRLSRAIHNENRATSKRLSLMSTYIIILVIMVGGAALALHLGSDMYLEFVTSQADRVYVSSERESLVQRTSAHLRLLTMLCKQTAAVFAHPPQTTDQMDSVAKFFTDEVKQLLDRIHLQFNRMDEVAVNLKHTTAAQDVLQNQPFTAFKILHGGTVSEDFMGLKEAALTLSAGAYLVTSSAIDNLGLPDFQPNTTKPFRPLVPPTPEDDLANWEAAIGIYTTIANAPAALRDAFILDTSYVRAMLGQRADELIAICVVVTVVTVFLVILGLVAFVRPIVVRVEVSKTQVLTMFLDIPRPVRRSIRRRVHGVFQLMRADTNTDEIHTRMDDDKDEGHDGGAAVDRGGEGSELDAGWDQKSVADTTHSGSRRLRPTRGPGAGVSASGGGGAGSGGDLPSINRPGLLPSPPVGGVNKPRTTGWGGASSSRNNNNNVSGEIELSTLGDGKLLNNAGGAGSVAGAGAGAAGVPGADGVVLGANVQGETRKETSLLARRAMQILCAKYAFFIIFVAVYFIVLTVLTSQRLSAVESGARTTDYSMQRQAAFVRSYQLAREHIYVNYDYLKANSPNYPMLVHGEFGTTAVKDLELALRLHHSVMFGNETLNLVVPPADDVQSGLLFTNGCGLTNNLPQYSPDFPPNYVTECRNFSSGLITQGLHPTILFLENSIRTLAMPGNKGCLNQLINSPPQPSTCTYDELYAAAVTFYNIDTLIWDHLVPMLRYSGGLYAKQARSHVDDFHQFRIAFLIGFILLLLFLHLVLFHPVIKDLNTAARNTRAMMLVLPPDIAKSIPSVQSFIEENIQRRD